ncbi:RNA polymerase sigma factor [Streptomyces sp. MMS24-I29]|uniref:RNA polymerase sigma factor n=1 Tax=Streptomyces sp. MMS24-I29 TaxID=3351480 RepID=UPI003C7B4135
MDAEFGDFLTQHKDLMELRGYDRLDRARAVLQERAPKQAECVRLRYFEEMGFAEIADRLNITPGAAKANVRLGLKALQALMNDGGAV